jgi:hypothetical protein
MGHSRDPARWSACPLFSLLRPRYEDNDNRCEAEVRRFQHPSPGSRSPALERATRALALFSFTLLWALGGLTGISAQPEALPLP